jgi:hypothetical protein
MATKKQKRELQEALFVGVLIGFLFGSFIGLALGSNSFQTTIPTQQIGLTVIVSNSPRPSGMVAYVPIYLSNPSNTTIAPMVLINISKSKYSAYLSQNESNLEFYYELPSWPESNSSLPKGAVAGHYFEILSYTIVESNSSTIIAIVQLPSSIAPNSNMTIYMGFIKKHD